MQKEDNFRIKDGIFANFWRVILEIFRTFWCKFGTSYETVDRCELDAVGIPEIEDWPLEAHFTFHII